MTDIVKAAKKLIDCVEFDMNGAGGKGGNGGLLSDTTLRAAHDLRVIMSREADREQRKPAFRLQNGMPFGISVLIDMPPGCDMVAVFADHPHHVPVWMGLPHQLYVTTFAKLLYDNAAASLTIVPYRNASKVTATENEIALALAEWASQPAKLEGGTNG
ncbi:hypothetical protein EGT36_08630 [Agrobacterium sp. FDAARGOS_525]|uniref:hypothetical protein n=1 Tax=Agrobacterium sp. FDAARGOS_525 TaxID=2420311 RepID=UPI000F68B0A5|nr:hypothetical protein [Agrobacterium sp. FDAARGOS_525]RSC37318.1 hypothetical protein EGT36_08630 [Agrobacterium sp. FDAARGOS_525]